MITLTEAEKIAFEFLTSEWNIPLQDQEWLTIISSSSLGEDGYRIEIGIEGFPDRWFLEVYDNGKCESYYEFNSPIRDSESKSDLEDLPDWITQVLIAERKQR